ncbi:MAG: hypothetical protein GF349_02730 [Candidatus Magasanikbacteria bacterium]|nr:hypothetical protein [Candidatus Magasanikbacteria bacterium]
MHFSWHGTTCVKIQTKPFDKDITIVLDPYKPTKGQFPRSLTPDIGLYSRGEKNSITLSGKPFTLSMPGECETKGVLIAASQSPEENKIIFRIDSEQMSVGFLGLLNKEPNDDNLSLLNGVDILIIPVGGKDCYDAEKAVKVVNTVEPRIVIPIAFKSENDPNFADVDKFLKEIGSKNGKPEKKIIIKKKDLPQDETRVEVLSKE